MKIVILFTASLFLAMAQAKAVTIAQWTFETSTTPSDLDNSTTQTGVLPSSGTGTASGVHASAATDWSTPPGNGSAESWSSNNWAVGDYWQFQVSTLGFEGISIYWDQISTATGPRDFALFWSDDGNTFTKFLNDYMVSPENPAWIASTYNAGYRFNRDLSSINALNNDASVYFRLQDMSMTRASGTGSVLGGGASRVDNFTVSGTAIAAVPESAPGLAGLGAMLGLLLVAAYRRAAFRRA